MMSHRPQKNKQLVDHLVLIGLIFAAILVTIVGHVNFLTSTILFFGIPSAYLIYRCPRNLKKATVAGVLLGLVLGFSLDFVAEFNHAWGWATNFVLPGSLFGIVSLDVLVWFFFWVFFIVAYYEYFIEHDKSTKLSKRSWIVFFGGILLASGVLVVWKFAPQLLVLPYAYAELGTFTFIVWAILSLKNPRLFKKTLRLLPFFALTYLAYEVTALSLHLWTFPGAYLGTVSIGTIRFPLEEFIFWIVASSAIVAIYYEFYIDDYR